MWHYPLSIPAPALTHGTWTLTCDMWKPCPMEAPSTPRSPSFHSLHPFISPLFLPFPMPRSSPQLRHLPLTYVLVLMMLSLLSSHLFICSTPICPSAIFLCSSIFSLLLYLLMWCRCWLLLLSIHILSIHSSLKSSKTGNLLIHHCRFKLCFRIYLFKGFNLEFLT